MGSTVTSVRVAGALLVERGLITPAELAEALEHQRAHGGELEEILPRLYDVSRSEVAAVTSDREAARRVDLGTILFATGIVDEERLGEARDRSMATGQPLGPILVEMGAITRLDLASALADQWADSPAEILPSPFVREALQGREDAEDGSDDLRSVMAALEVSMRAARETGGESGAIAELLQREADLTARIAAVEHAIDQPVEADPALVAEIHGIAEGLDALRSSLESVAKAEDVEALQGAVADVDVLRTRLDELAELVQRAVPRDLLEQACADLTSLAVRVDGLAPLDAVEQARADLAALTDRVEHLSLAGSEVGAMTEALGELRTHQADLREGQLELRDAVAGLHEGVVELRDGHAELAARPTADTTLSEELGRVHVLLDAVGATADAAAPGAVLDSLRDEVSGRLGPLDEVGDDIRALQEAVAELSARTEPDTELAAHVESLATDLATTAAALEERLEVALASADDAPDLAAGIARLEERLATLETVEDELTSLRASLAALRERPAAEDGLADRLETLAGRVEALSLDALGPAAEAAVGALAGRVEALAAASDETRAHAAELATRLADLTEAVAARADDAPTDDGGLAELSASLAELSDRIDASAPATGLAALVLAVEELQSLELPHDRRLGELEQRVDRSEALAAGAIASEEAIGALRVQLDALAAATGARFDAMLGRLDGLDAAGAATETPVDVALRSELETLGATVDSVRASFAAGLERLERAWEDERASLRDLAGVGRGGDLESGAAVPPSVGTPGPELAALERELERLRDRVVEQERSLVEHFARRERALIERLGSGTDVGQRLTEVTRGLEELRVRVDRRMSSAGDGGPSGEELAALKESVYGRLEKLASSIDWRFQRLEGGPGTAAGAADLQTRLNELTRVVEGLADGTPANGRTAAPDGIYLALVPTAIGHQLVELHGTVPATGDVISVPEGDGELRVVAVGASPLPGDDRACVFVEAAAAPASA